jgi:LysM repeat protein
LRIGQTITIPPPSAEDQGPVAGEGETIYEVRPGDNLTKISREYGTTIDAIKEANNLQTDRINVGQKLVIPSADDNGNGN